MKGRQSWRVKLKESFPCLRWEAVSRSHPRLVEMVSEGEASQFCAFPESSEGLDLSRQGRGRSLERGLLVGGSWQGGRSTDGLRFQGAGWLSVSEPSSEGWSAGWDAGRGPVSCARPCLSKHDGLGGGCRNTAPGHSLAEAARACSIQVAGSKALASSLSGCCAVLTVCDGACGSWPCPVHCSGRALAPRGPVPSACLGGGQGQATLHAQPHAREDRSLGTWGDFPVTSGPVLPLLLRVNCPLTASRRREGGTPTGHN